VCLQALEQAGIKNAACVVLGTGGGHPTDAEADARVLASLLQVRLRRTYVYMRHGSLIVRIHTCPVQPCKLPHQAACTAISCSSAELQRNSLAYMCAGILAPSVC
jgi:hypothetical protein